MWAMSPFFFLLFMKTCPRDPVVEFAEIESILKFASRFVCTPFFKQ